MNIPTSAASGACISWRLTSNVWSCRLKSTVSVVAASTTALKHDPGLFGLVVHRHPLIPVQLAGPDSVLPLDDGFVAGAQALQLLGWDDPRQDDEAVVEQLLRIYLHRSALLPVSPGPVVPAHAGNPRPPAERGGYRGARAGPAAPAHAEDTIARTCGLDGASHVRWHSIVPAGAILAGVERVCAGRHPAMWENDDNRAT